jgi:hypothetical protein
LAQIGCVQRIKIFQRSVEKKSSVFVTFRAPEVCQKAVHYLKLNPLLFKDMKEPLDVEYPTQDISKNPPAFATAAPVGLSKKARKQLAAENRIAYIRSNDDMDPILYQKELSFHGPVQVHMIKRVPPCTAFAVFDTPKACSEALQQKTMGCNLPRHKRVDFVLQGVSEEEVLHFLSGIDIKQTTSQENLLTVEFWTALGAAKAIVKTKMIKVAERIFVSADYSPSIKPESEPTESHIGDDDGDNSKQGTEDGFKENETISMATILVSCGPDSISAGYTSSEEELRNISTIDLASQ